MAFVAPAAVFLEENLPIHRGKRADGLDAKPLKPSAKSTARKALRDLSNTSKPPVPSIKGLKDRSVLKEKSALRSQETLKKNPVNKTTIFADQATKNCHEWAKGGVEGTHFTGNDAQKLDEDKLDKHENLHLRFASFTGSFEGGTFQYVHVTDYINYAGVKKKVEKINSALHDWTDVIFDHLLFPSKAVAPFYEEVNVLELEPEILPEITSRRLSTSGDLAKLAEDSLGEAEHEDYLFLENKPIEFQLRDDLDWMN